MAVVYNTKQYTIGGIRFQVNFLSPFFGFDGKGGSFYFQEIDGLKKQDWTINYRSVNETASTESNVVFTGSDHFEDEMPFKWSIVQINQHTGIQCEFENHPNIAACLAIINEKNKTIDFCIKTNTPEKIEFDPFFHPAGIHILQYIAHLNKGFIIHASTVNYKNKGYLFSAVSGTGKSTMAALFKHCGATIINDDRLMVMPKDNSYTVFNTPMPYYQDKNKEVKLHKAFLIKQSPKNYIKELPTLQGTIGLLGNCMQYQYDEKQVQQRLSALHSIAENCGVYECGFKPDIDIVELIQKRFG